MSVLVVIVNYRTPSMTLDAVRATYPQLDELGAGSKIVVVDNDSNDGSFETLRDRVAGLGMKDRVEVVPSGRNGGFGAGNNVAIRDALRSRPGVRHFYIQNPDAFPEPGALRKLVDHLESHPEVGIAGSYIHGVDGEPHRTAFRFPTVASELETYARLGPISRVLRRFIVSPPIPDATRLVDWLAGASMMIRREVFETVGLFDEDFFLYFEETDLCRRARAAGFLTAYVRESVVAHIGHGSTGLKDRAVPRPEYWFVSRRRYFAKNHGRAYLALSNAAAVTGLVLDRARRKVQRMPLADPPRFFRDFVRFTLVEPKNPPA